MFNKCNNKDAKLTSVSNFEEIFELEPHIHVEKVQQAHKSFSFLLENLKNKPKTHAMHFKLHTQFNSLFLRNEVTSALSEDTIVPILK